jgi:putative ABC transport system permease protein
VAVVGQGVEPSKEIRLSSMFIKIDEGRSLTGEDQDPYQIVIGSELARNLGAKANQNVTLMATTEDGAINALDVRIAGIYSTGIPEQDKHAVMVPLNIAKSLLRTQKVSKIIVALDKTEYTDAVISQLKKDLSNVDIRSWIALAFYYQRVVILYRNVFCIMGAIILLVVLLSSINSMLMNIMERVREVGTMRSMGIPRYEITKVFLLEGTFVGLLGTVAGAILAIILSMAINVLEIKMAPPPGRNMPYPLVIMMDCDYYLVITLIMVVVSSIAAWLPARRVVKMKIVDALGHN